MPLYTISIEEGALSPDAKATLATQITEFHCKMASLDKAFVKIIFNTYRRGDAFVGGEIAKATTLTVLIRDGRSPEYKSTMATKLWTLLQQATGAPDSAMLVAIQEEPATQAMEMGQIMPEVATGRRS